MKTSNIERYYYLKLWQQEEDLAATIVQFNAYYRIIYHDQDKPDADFYSLNKALFHLMELGYQFLPGSVFIKNQ